MKCPRCGVYPAEIKLSFDTTYPYLCRYCAKQKLRELQLIVLRHYNGHPKPPLTMEDIRVFDRWCWEIENKLKEARF